MQKRLLKVVGVAVFDMLLVSVSKLCRACYEQARLSPLFAQASQRHPMHEVVLAQPSWGVLPISDMKLGMLVVYSSATISCLMPGCLLHADTSLLRPSVCSTLPPAPGLFARLLCGAPPPLVPLLAEQKLQLLCLARMPFSDEEPMHMRLLCTLFAAFTGGMLASINAMHAILSMPFLSLHTAGRHSIA